MGCTQLDCPESTAKVQRKRPARTRPSEAVPLTQELAGNRLAEAKTMSFPKFEHAPNGFWSCRLSRGCALWRFRKGGFLNQGQ